MLPVARSSAITTWRSSVQVKIDVSNALSLLSSLKQEALLTINNLHVVDFHQVFYNLHVMKPLSFISSNDFLCTICSLQHNLLLKVI